VAAIDQGTTGTRCIIFDRSGLPVGSDYLEHQQITPQPGWVEHDAREIWENVRLTVRSALINASIQPADIVGIGITNQRETTVLWDEESGEPVGNAIVWQDLRTDAICERLRKSGLEGPIRRKTGLPIATYFSGPKLAWMLENWKPKNKAALRFGTVDSWLIYCLSGRRRHLTDATNASRTMLMDLRKLRWDPELLEALRIPASLLPEIKPSSDPQAYGTAAGLGRDWADVPIAAALGDQQAALFGQCCFHEGEAKNTYGTGNFLLLHTGEKPVSSRHGLLTTVAAWIAGRPATYALEGSVAVSGAAVQWLRDNLKIIRDAAETEEIAKSVNDNGGVYFVPAFSGLFAPHWDMYARGAILGLTRYARAAHLVRATLEAICFQNAEIAQAMSADSSVKLRSLKVDGGAVANNFLMQLQADILGVEVVRPTVRETTALGAAYAAGLAVGFWKDLQALRANWRAERTFRPESSPSERRKAMAGWQKAVERSRRWVD
jgi:glycerol kinase